jgi:hypothetical protein
MPMTLKRLIPRLVFLLALLVALWGCTGAVLQSNSSNPSDIFRRCYRD